MYTLNLTQILEKEHMHFLDSLQITLDLLDEGEYFSAMAWIYAAYVCLGRFPPYGIVQHAVDETLLKQYCVLLRKWLQKYRKTGKI